MTIPLQDYINSFAKKKVEAKIHKDWDVRITKTGVPLTAAGARQHIGNYGGAWAAPKAAQYALLAQSFGANEMAMVFWNRSYELEFKCKADNDATVGVTAVGNGRMMMTQEIIPSFPARLQPGAIVPMQPDDTEVSVETLINDPDYSMQAKRDGKKFLLFATPEQAWAQTRSMRVVEIPSAEMEAALISVARNRGPFILETEIYYLSGDGKQHRTGSQASTWAQKHHDYEPPQIKCAPFYAIFGGGEDLMDQTHAKRVDAGIVVTRELRLKTDIFDLLATAYSASGKQALYLQQKSEGREGVVFTRTYAPYHPDKQGTDVLRVKFPTESIVRVVGLQPTTAEGKLFGAIMIVDADGNDLGKIGNGFDRGDESDVVMAFAQNPSNTWIEVRHYGWTENGKVWTGSFRGLVDRG